MKIKFKLLFFLYLSCNGIMMGQFGVGSSYIQSIGERKASFKPTLSIDVMVRTPVDDKTHFQFSIYASYFSHEAVKDTFSTYGFTNRTGPVTIVSGYERLFNHTALLLGVNLDYRLVNSSFSPFIGIDLFTMLEGFDYQKVFEGISDITSNEEITHFGLGPRLGYNYVVSQLLFTAESSFQIFYSSKGLGMQLKASLSCSYFF